MRIRATLRMLVQMGPQRTSTRLTSVTSGNGDTLQCRTIPCSVSRMFQHSAVICVAYLVFSSGISYVVEYIRIHSNTIPSAGDEFNV